MRLITRARNLLAPKYQVPIKYWYRRSIGGLEPEMEWLKSIVLPGERAIDVGGNRGIYAYALSRQGVRVEVFEPHLDCCRVLREWARKHDAVTVHAVALSSRTGLATLRVPIDQDGVEHDASGSLETCAAPSIREQSVAVTTLDSYHFDRVSLIKIDVEGHECAVLEGAIETIAMSAPALLVEIEQRHIARPINQAFDYILSLGYRGFFMAGRTLLPLRCFEPSRHQPPTIVGVSSVAYVNNFLFLPLSGLGAGRYSSFSGGRLPE